MFVRFLCLVFVLCFVQIGRGDSDPWTARETIQTDELATLLTKNPPQILMVGPRVLYNGAHIKTAVYAGPGGKPEGLYNLVNAVGSFPKGRQIAIYCGCCPMDKCPNIRPAFQKLKAMGYQDVKVVIIPTNLHEDWTSKGYPVEKGDIPQ